MELTHKYGTLSKEEQLKDLKTELVALDRKIQLSLKPIEQGESEQEGTEVMQDGEGKAEELERSRPIEPTVAAPPSAPLRLKLTDRWKAAGRVSPLHNPLWTDCRRLWRKRRSLSDRRYKTKGRITTICNSSF